MVGFDVSNKNILDEKFICSTCSLVLRDPIQFISCGHRMCKTCLNAQTQVTVKCVQCQIEISPNEVITDRAFLKESQSVPVICFHCNWTDILQNYETHLDQCHSNPVCRFCQQQFNSIHQLNEHQVAQCEKATVACLLKNFGCDQEILRSELSNHYCTRQHQESAMKVVSMMKTQLIKAQRIEYQMDTDNSQSFTSVHDNNYFNQLESLLETVGIIERAVLSFDVDANAINDELIDTTRKVHDLLNHAKQVMTIDIEEDNELIGAIEENLKILNESMVLMKEAINNAEYVSHDGTFTWKIDDVLEKLRDAQSERQTSIYSPPFYSSSTGYKMRARLYFNGDGNARGTHLSLFFVLMRGRHDAILKFPFNYKVTFCLYDQTPQQRHIIDSFRPDIKSNSFQRPRSEMNIASGIPKFFPLSMIQQEGNPYVRDDTMFIKVMVDFNNTPKHLIPYAMSLNPGLPNGVQHELVRLECERRAAQEKTE